MAGRFPRTYSRKRLQPAPPIDEFDALVTDNSVSNSNQPAATKTARHIGKWGMTTYTSLRAINNGIAREEGGYRRNSDSPPSSALSYSDTLYNNGGDAALPAAVSKPVNTYKRRKFFKSRAGPEEDTSSGVSSANTSSGVTSANTCSASSNNGKPAASSTSSSTGFNSTYKSSTSSATTTTINQKKSFDTFDSILPNHNTRDVISVDEAEESSTTISLPTTLSLDDRADSPISMSVDKILDSKHSQSSSSSSGIKLKIFKSRNTESWSQNEYSSKVELPSDDSSSSSACSSSSSPSSPEPPAVIASNGVVADDGQAILSGKPTSSNTTELFSTPSAASEISLPSLDSTLPRSTSHTMYDSTVPSYDVDSTLDSSLEFGDIIDQRTGLPSKVYSKFNDKNDSSINSPIRPSSPLQSIRETVSTKPDPIRSQYSYSRDSKSQASRNKNSFAASSSVNNVFSSDSTLPETKTDENSSTGSVSNRRKCAKSYNRTSVRSYGIKVTPSTKSDSLLTHSNIQQSTAIDVRNSQTNSDNLSDVCKYGNISSDKREPSLSTTESKNPVTSDHGLFSTDFDENEIVDRTLINASDNKTSDVQLESKNTSDIDDILGIKDFKSYRSSSSRGDSILKKSVSLPSRTEASADSSIDSKQPAAKKRSIFKSRVVQAGDSKKRATYNHKWHSSTEEKDELRDTSKAKVTAQASASTFDDFDFDGGSEPTLKRVKTWSASANTLSDIDAAEPGSAITSVKCNKEAKQYYTVIKNVKKLHQLQESGEFQEFNDDVEYFLEALSSSNSPSTRCLAALNLAQKCMTPAFRMHLRAHATVCKFFKALQDAPKHPALSLCSAMVMFALSQDRLNMDLDRDSLELMLNLLDSDAADGSTNNSSSNSSSNGTTNSTITEVNAKIRDLCRQLQKKGHAKHLDLDSIDAGTLAMETLLSLTSKRAGEWFKEELRELGGIDHLMRTITTCVMQLPVHTWDKSFLDTLSKIERCLKVLENVTHQNESNQEYLLEYESSQFVTTLMNLYKMCHLQVPLAAAKGLTNTADNKLSSPPPAKGLVQPSPSKKEQSVTELQGVSSALITTLKVLVNITHNSRKLGLGSKILGARESTYEITLRCLLSLPRYMTHQNKFDLMVLTCCLLLNLVEHSTDNRIALLAARNPCSEAGGGSGKHGAMKALVELFYSCEASAKEHESHTDQIIDTDLDERARAKKKEDKEDELEETVAKLLQKAGRHMEDTVIAAYTAFLAGYCLMDNEDSEEAIRAMQPEGHFKVMVSVLKKFLHFMNLTATTSLLRSLKPTERVVKYMEQLDPPEDGQPSTSADAKKEQAEDDDDSDIEADPSDDLYDAFGF